MAVEKRGECVAVASRNIEEPGCQDSEYRARLRELHPYVVAKAEKKNY